jgi:hypothetical protein
VDFAVDVWTVCGHVDTFCGHIRQNGPAKRYEDKHCLLTPVSEVATEEHVGEDGARNTLANVTV